MERQMKQSNEPIDFVIAWVDGNDQKWKREKKRKDYVNYYKTLTNYYYNVEVKFIDQTKKIMNTYTEILNPLIDTLSLIARDNNFIEEIDSKKDTEKFSRT